MRIRSSRKGGHIFFLLEQNAQNARKAGRLLRELLERPDDVEGADAMASAVEEIAALERFGDEVAQQTVFALQAARSAPMDRRDLVVLTDALDGIVDGIGSVASSMLAYGIGAPSERARTMAVAISQSCADLQKSVTLLHVDPARQADVLSLTAAVRERAAAVERENGGLLAPHFADGQDAEIILKWRDVYADLRRALAHTRAAAVVLEGALMPRHRR